MVQKTQHALGFPPSEALPVLTGTPSVRGKGGRRPKEEEDLQNQLIRTNVTSREWEQLHEEYRQFRLARKVSFAAFIREKLNGMTTSHRFSREEQLMETLQYLQDCRLALQNSDHEGKSADSSGVATTLNRIDTLVDRLAAWWFD